MENTITLISLNDACVLTSLSRTMINKLRARGEFPQTVYLSEKRVAFVKSEVEDWITDRINVRNRRRQSA